ncbi:DUF2169 family type VI secretion system accessory protein [Paracoccus zhejiangensis]|nr:DUF2169 domain-containing protein [Paracoccus zhejiangensis]
MRLLFFKHWTGDSDEVGIVIAKALFRRRAGTAQLFATVAPPLCLEDIFRGDPAWTPLQQEQEIAPGKAGTDLIIRAVARPQGDRSLTSWPVSVFIANRLRYRFLVRGPTVWTYRRWRGWRRSLPIPVSQVPISYDLAFGGHAPGPDGAIMVYEHNPAGLGFVTRERLAARHDIRIPQIGDDAGFLTTDPLAEMPVHGFGPIAKPWLPRRRMAGTFDQRWLNERHPRMPEDHSLRFWNAAQAEMVLEPPLQGDEEIVVAGISRRPDDVRVCLPRFRCHLDLSGTEHVQLPMTLDTVMLDLEADDPQSHSATMIWRARVEAPDRFDAADVISQRLET